MIELLLLQSAAIVAGFLIDFFVGDPHALPHPVIWIGRLIALLDQKLRRGDRRDIRRGGVTVLIVIAVSTILPALLLIAARAIHPAAYLVLQSVMCWQMLAARQLVRESDRVRVRLNEGDLDGAREAVSYIVGRDTDALDRDGVCRAAVETVAENTCDGVIAPLLWMLLFGAAGGFFYKAVNTMDSMIGYKNEKYRYFGRVAAKCDDAVNYIPARLSALSMLAVCPILRMNTKNAWRIFRRDRYKHPSPNSAQTESVCAGALQVQLAGDAFYGGVLHKKDFIGDPIRRIEPDDIKRANRLMYTASALMLTIGMLLRIGVILLCISIR
jgi:adenosylcobinamide-phosphate synthase